MPKRRSDTMRAVDAVMPLVDEFNLLDDGDKLTFLDLVDPLPEKHDHRPKKKASKKSSKSSQQPSSKSPRASGIHAQLNKNLKQQRQQLALCAHVSEDGDDPTQCGEAESSGIHDPTMGYRDYHPFSPAAPPAPAPSPANGGAVDESASAASGD